MLTQKIRIFPSQVQEDVLWALSERCRLLYNFALAERLENWKKNIFKPKEEQSYVSYGDQQDNLPKIKEKYPEYKWVYSKVLQMTLRQLDANYKSFFKLRKKGYKDAQQPRFKGKKHFYTLCYIKAVISLEMIVSDFLTNIHQLNN